MSFPQYSTGADTDHGDTPSPVRAVSFGASQTPSNPVAPASVVGSAPQAGNPVSGALTASLALPPPTQPGPRTAPAGPVTVGPAPVGTAPTPVTVGPAPVGTAPVRSGGPAPVGPTPTVPLTTRGTIPPADGQRRAGATAIPPAAG